MMYSFERVFTPGGERCIDAAEIMTYFCRFRAAEATMTDIAKTLAQNTPSAAPVCVRPTVW